MNQDLCQITRLPTEVLEKTLRYVKSKDEEPFRKDTFECIRVCKSWKYTAQSIAYSSISLQNNMALNDIRFKRLKNSMASSSDRLGRFVKSFRYDYLGLTENDLQAIFSMFPFVEHLYSPAIPCSNLYPTLAMLRFPHLKSFTVPTKAASDHSDTSIDNLLDSYFCCSLEYCNTITIFSFEAGDWNNQRRLLHSYTTSYKKVFPNLTRLYIADHFEVVTRYNGDLLESILDGCNDNAIQTLYFDTFFFDTTKIDTTAIMPCLAVQSLTIHSLHSSSSDTVENSELIYIQHKFPQLKKFNIVNLEWTYNNMKHFSKSLLNYFSSIPVFSINFNCRKILSEDIDMLSENFWGSPAMKNKFKNLKVSYQPPYLTDTGVADERSNGQVFLVQSETSVLSSITINFHRYAECYDILAIGKLIRSHGEHIQRLALAIGRPDYFFYITTDNNKKPVIKPSNSSTAREKKEDQIVLDTLLTSALGLCRNLTHLSLGDLSIEKIYDAGFGVYFRSLRELELSNCKFPTGFLFNLSRNIPKLTKLTIDSCRHKEYIGEDRFSFSKPEHFFLNIYMPHTAIDTLYFKNIHVQTHIKLNHDIVCRVKIKREDKAKYFAVKYKQKILPRIKISGLTKAMYLKARALKIKKNIFYSVQCKSINKIVINESSYHTATTTYISKKKKFNV